MAEHVSRLPFTLDPLIADAKRRMRRRRWRFYIWLVVVAIASLAFGLTIGLRSPAGPSSVVPTNVSEIDIHALVGPATAPHIFSRRITDPTQLQRITGWFNSLTPPPSSRSRIHCAGSFGSTVMFRFRSANSSELVTAGFPPANDFCGEPLRLIIPGQQDRNLAPNADGTALIVRLTRLLGPRFQPTMGGAG